MTYFYLLKSPIVDDNTLYTPGRNEQVGVVEKFMQESNRIIVWFKVNSLSANPKKSDKPKRKTHSTLL